MVNIFVDFILHTKNALVSYNRSYAHSDWSISENVYYVTRKMTFNKKYQYTQVSVSKNFRVTFNYFATLETTLMMT